LLVVLLSTFAGGTPLKKEINTPSPKRIFGKKMIIRIFISLFNEPVSSKILFSLSLLVEKHKNKIINFETITPS
jgi:hypothetical protein